MTNTSGNDLALGSSYRSNVEAEVVADVDVIVAGAGTAGCVAAIAAARRGAKVLLVERQGHLGGMMTRGNAGLTKFIVHGQGPEKCAEISDALATDPASVQAVGGITVEIVRRLIDTGAGLGTHGQAGAYVFTAQQEFKWLLLDLMKESHVEVLFHSFIVDAAKKDDAVCGIVVENKSGRQALLGRIVVDATGDGDVAAKAGAPFVVGVGPDDLAAKDGTPAGTMMGMGAMFRMGNVDMEKCFAFLDAHPDRFRLQSCANIPLETARENFRQGEMMTILVKGRKRNFQIYNSPLPGVVTLHCNTSGGDGLSATDLSRNEFVIAERIRADVAEVKADIPGFEHAFVLGVPEVGVRETRHIRGEYVLNEQDIFTQREFEDTVGRGCHPFDISPIPDFMKDRLLPPRWYFNIPYRCLVPLKVENLLVAGRCISATHEAGGCIRPTAQCMVTGEAAGTGAGLCVRREESPRSLDVSALRRALKEQGVVL